MVVLNSRDGAAKLPGEPRLSARLLVAAVGAGVGLALCYLLMVHLRAGRAFDQAAFAGAVREGQGPADRGQAILRTISDKSLFVALVVIFAIGIIRRRPFLGCGAALAAGGAVAATQLLKYHVLDRSIFASTAISAGDTFPSGHTTVAIACAMGLVLVCPARLRGAAALLAGVYAGLVAVQVQAAGWHRPSDALGSAFLSFGCIAVVAGILAWIRPVGPANARRLPLAEAVLVVITVGCLVLTVVGLQTLTGPLGWNASQAVQHRAYLTGLATTIGTVAALLAALLLLLRGVELDAPASDRRYLPW